MTETNPTFLLCTVGGSPEPIVASLRHWAPRRVLFLPSKETHGDIESKIVPLLAKQTSPLDPGVYDVVPLPDAQDLSGCVRKLRELTPRVEDWLARGDKARHSSPIHIHIARDGGGYRVRILALPAVHLPDLQTSRRFLSEFLQFIEGELNCRAKLPPPARRRPPAAVSSGASLTPPASAARSVAPAPPSDWEEINTVYLKRIGQAHLVELPDGKKVRVERGVPPSPPKKNGEVVKIYRQGSGSRECRWQPPPMK